MFHGLILGRVKAIYELSRHFGGLMRARLTQMSRVTPFGLFALEFFYLSFIHSWEVDPHHDGIMYTAAVGAYEGKVPNRDFFAQYGPISPIIQGLWFRLTDPTVWNLRLLASLGLAFIGALIYIGARRRLSILTSVLLSSCWVLSGPFGLPWSSVFSTIFILGSLLLFESIFSSQFQGKSRYYGFFIGVLLALGTFTRIHTLVVFFAATLGLLAFRDPWKYRRIAALVSLGYFLTLISITLALAKHDALKAYLNQCILWASGRYAGGPELSISFFFNLMWIPLFGITNLLILKHLSNSKSLKVSYTLKITLPIFFFYSVLVLLSQLQRSGPETLRNPRILSIIAGQKAQFSFNFLVLTFFVGLLAFGLYKSVKGKNLELFVGNKSQIVYVLIAVATLTQLYPYADEYHIAFIVPIVIVASVFVLPQELKSNRSQLAFRYLAVVLIPTLITHALILANVGRVEFKSKTLTGMYGSWQSTKPLDLTMLQLERERPGIRFLCADGLYAGAGGQYLSDNEKFVNWGPPSTGKRVANREFVCSADQQLISSYGEQGWQVKFKVLLSPQAGSSNISYWNVLFERFESVTDKEGVR